MDEMGPPPQFGIGVIPPTSIGPQVPPETWRRIEQIIREGGRS